MSTEKTARPLVIARNQMAAVLRADGHYSKPQALARVDGLIGLMTSTLRQGHTLHLKGFGRFTVAAVPARSGRNLKTGEPCVIPAGRRVKFKASQRLLEEAP
jgi:DNA-binding protein HU-beta